MTALVAGGMAVGAILPCFSKVFATLSHSILVAKVVRCGLVVGGGSVPGLAQYNVFTFELGKCQNTPVVSSRWRSDSCQSLQALPQGRSQFSHL